MALIAGTNINQYKIISSLGSGGMGEVYLAQDTKLRRKVALKLLFDEVTKNEDWVRRFEQEAYTASALNHPNIITIYEIAQTGGSHFISAEFIEGDTLRQYLSQRNVTIVEVLDIVIQVATALVAAHAAALSIGISNQKTSWCVRTATSKCWISDWLSLLSNVAMALRIAIHTRRPRQTSIRVRAW